MKRIDIYLMANFTVEFPRTSLSHVRHALREFIGTILEAPLSMRLGVDSMDNGRLLVVESNDRELVLTAAGFPPDKPDEEILAETAQYYTNQIVQACESVGAEFGGGIAFIPRGE